MHLGQRHWVSQVEKMNYLSSDLSFNKNKSQKKINKNKFIFFSKHNWINFKNFTIHNFMKWRLFILFFCLFLKRVGRRTSTAPPQTIHRDADTRYLPVLTLLFDILGNVPSNTRFIPCSHLDKDDKFCISSYKKVTDNRKDESCKIHDHSVVLFDCGILHHGIKVKKKETKLCC